MGLPVASNVGVSGGSSKWPGSIGYHAVEGLGTDEMRLKACNRRVARTRGESLPELRSGIQMPTFARVVDAAVILAALSSDATVGAMILPSSSPCWPAEESQAAAGRSMPRCGNLMETPCPTKSPASATRRDVARTLAASRAKKNAARAEP